MEKIRWRFPLLDGGETSGFNNSGIQTFAGAELYNNLAREICQNSLDAASKKVPEPVLVKFINKRVPIKEYKEITGLEPIIKRCEEYDNNTDKRFNDFIKEAKKVFEQEEIDLLAISDYKTTGLSGAKEGPYAITVFNGLTSSAGLTVKENDTSAGSYGIGKSAPFGCSKLHTVFYNTFSEKDNVRAFKGVSRLVTHNSVEDDKPTQGVGSFQNQEDLMPIFEEDNSSLRDLFNRTEYGTDVIIVGFQKDNDWERSIEKAVLRNFFAALNDGKLVVQIMERILDSNSIGERIKFYSKNDEQDSENNLSMKQVEEFYSTLTMPDDIFSGKIVCLDDIKMFIRKNDGYNNQIARMRSSEMLIEVKTKNMLVHYCAIVIARGEEINKYLRDMENPTHQKWDPKIIQNNEEEQKTASGILQKINKWVNETVKNYCTPENSDEIELAGISQFLPFSETDISLGQTKGKSSSPESLLEFDEQKSIKNRIRKKNMQAIKVRGFANEYENNDDSPKPGGNIHLPGGIPDSEGDKDIITPGEGKKNVKIPKVVNYRIMKAPENRAYRIIYKLENDASVLHFQLFSIGEDGSRESVLIEEYKMDKTRIKSNQHEIVMHNVKCDCYNEVFVYLKDDEKMRLVLSAY